jgi:5-methyltetrahydrofolate--homocysteine methyltransferase
MTELENLGAAVASGNRLQTKQLTQAILDTSVPPQDIVERGLVPGMVLIGERFKRGEAFVPELLIAARAMKEAMVMLEPLLAQAGITPKYTAIIGTVQGDLHDIGKNLVAMMWRGANINVIDLGTNVPVDRFIAAAWEYHPLVIGLSALLTTTMPAMREAVAAMRAQGINDAKIVVGGAPITRDFAASIGADGFAPDAASAVDVVKQLMEV